MHTHTQHNQKFCDKCLFVMKKVVMISSSFFLVGINICIGVVVLMSIIAKQINDLMFLLSLYCLIYIDEHKWSNVS